MTMKMTSTKGRKTLQCRARQTSAKRPQVNKPTRMPPLQRRCKRNYSHIWRRIKRILPIRPKEPSLHKRTTQARSKRTINKTKTLLMPPTRRTKRLT